MSRQQRKDRRAASVAQQQQELQHSTGGTSKVRLKNELESAVEAHFLYGEGERLFTTRDPTGVEGAANVIKEKNLIIGPPANHNNLATSDISTLTDMILRSDGGSAHKVPEHVVAAWVAFYTLPEKRTTLAEILRACIVYPPNPQVDVSISDIKICNILPSPTPTASQQPQQSWIHSFFRSRQEQSTATAVSEQSRPPIGMRCEEIIKFKVKDVDNSAPVEDVVMTIQYDLVAAHNRSSGTDDVELRDLSFCVTPATEFEQQGNSSANKCVWKARQRCTRVFLSTELNLIRAASKSEAADILDNSVMSGNGPQQASTLTYKQRLQMLLDAQEMQKQAKETHARISPQSTNSSTQKQILFKDTEFLKNNKDVCTRIFVSPSQEAEEMLGAFVHTVIADNCADKQNTKPEYFQKISFKIPLANTDEKEESFKVVEHGSVHIPLSGQNIHALLSYIVTKRVTSSVHKPEIVISKARLGVRRVPIGFKLHPCSWVRYRSTDFITFVIPDLSHTCVTSTLPTCWHQAKEYRALVSPYPKNTATVISQQNGIAPAEHHITVPVIQPGQGEGQKPWATGASEKKPGVQSETRGGERSTDYAASGRTNVHNTTDYVESDKQEHRINEKQRQWIDQMVTQAASTHYCADTDDHSFESHITRFVEAHKQPNADSHTRRSGEAFDYDTPRGFFGVNDIEELEPQSEPESGRHPTKEKGVPHGSGRSKTKKPLPHSEEKPQSRLLWLLSAIWKSILLILQFLIVTPLVYIYKLCTQYAAQSQTTTTNVPEEASDKSAKKSATEKQKESTSFFARLRRRAKNLSAATSETDAATPKQKKLEKRNENAANTPTPSKAPDKEGAKRPTERKDVRRDQQTSNTAPTNTTSNMEENPSDQAEVSSTLQEPKIENAFFEGHSVLYPM